MEATEDDDATGDEDEPAEPDLGVASVDRLPSGIAAAKLEEEGASD